MAELGDYFAWKLRSACFWELHLRTAEMRAAEQAIDAYRRALSGWKAAAATAQDPYLPDLMYGPQNYLRGRWDDRVPAIEQDIAAMELAVAAAPAGSDAGQSVSARLLAWPQLERPRWTHRPAPHFRHGEPIHLTLTIEGVQRPDVHLHYRHVNQAEPWRSTFMTLIDETYNSMIPSAYTENAIPCNITSILGIPIVRFLFQDWNRIFQTNRILLCVGVKQSRIRVPSHPPCTDC